MERNVSLMRNIQSYFDQYGNEEVQEPVASSSTQVSPLANILEQSITPDASFVAERYYNNGNDLLVVSPLPKLNEIYNYYFNITIYLSYFC